MSCFELSETSDQLCFGFAEPPATGRPFSGDYIQFSRPFLNPLGGRLYFDPLDELGRVRPKRIADAFEGLRRFVRRECFYDKEYAMWVPRDQRSGFEEAAARFEKERENELDRNLDTLRKWPAEKEKR